MQIGSLTVELLSEGTFELFHDGHINRSLEDAPPSAGFMNKKVSRSSLVGINPVLVKKGGDAILLDTGLGWGLDAGSAYDGVSNVCTNLAIFGLGPEDITHVILSHLHYDHAAGASYTDSKSQTRVAFPNATYYLHQQEWDYARSQNEKDSTTRGAGYHLDEFYRLIADGCVELLSDKRTEILDSFTLIRTGGHTPGHQIVRLHSGEESAYYLGDLIPSALHLNQYNTHLQDENPIEAKKEKVQLLQKAYREQAIMLFYHSRHGQSGRLIKDEDKQYVLADIPKE